MIVLAFDAYTYHLHPICISILFAQRLPSCVCLLVCERERERGSESERESTHERLKKIFRCAEYIASFVCVCHTVRENVQEF